MMNPVPGLRNTAVTTNSNIPESKPPQLVCYCTQQSSYLNVVNKRGKIMKCVFGELFVMAVLRSIKLSTFFLYQLHMCKDLAFVG